MLTVVDHALRGHQDLATDGSIASGPLPCDAFEHAPTVGQSRSAVADGDEAPRPSTITAPSPRGPRPPSCGSAARWVGARRVAHQRVPVVKTSRRAPPAAVRGRGGPRVDRDVEHAGDGYVPPACQRQKPSRGTGRRGAGRARRARRGRRRRGAGARGGRRSTSRWRWPRCRVRRRRRGGPSPRAPAHRAIESRRPPARRSNCPRAGAGRARRVVVLRALLPHRVEVLQALDELRARHSRTRAFASSRPCLQERLRARHRVEQKLNLRQRGRPRPGSRPAEASARRADHQRELAPLRHHRACVHRLPPRPAPRGRCPRRATAPRGSPGGSRAGSIGHPEVGPRVEPSASLKSRDRSPRRWRREGRLRATPRHRRPPRGATRE